MSVVGNKVRIYDLAKELKQDTKRVMEELRREGADVSVPSNSVPKEIADKIRNKYFPKKETAPAHAIKLIKKTHFIEPIETQNVVENTPKIVGQKEEKSISTPVVEKELEQINTIIKPIRLKKVEPKFIKESIIEKEILEPVVELKIVKTPISEEKKIESTTEAVKSKETQTNFLEDIVQTIIHPIKPEAPKLDQEIEPSYLKENNESKPIKAYDFEESSSEIEKISIKNSSTELKVDCRICINPTKHDLLQSEKNLTTFGNEEYQIVQCRGCESLSFRRVTNKQITNKDGSKTDKDIDLYPSRIKGRQKLRLESIPEIITEIYEEIHLALSNKLFVLATIGMRTLIEAVCKEQCHNPNAKNLKYKIEDLVDNKILTRKNADNLHKLRDFGNDATHEANIQSEEVLNKCMDIIEHLLKDVYSPEISN